MEIKGTDKPNKSNPLTVYLYSFTYNKVTVSVNNCQRPLDVNKIVIVMPVFMICNTFYQFPYNKFTT